MSRIVIVPIVIIVVVAAALFALSRLDPSRTPHRIEKVVPENALAH